MSAVEWLNKLGCILTARNRNSTPAGITRKQWLIYLESRGNVGFGIAQSRGSSTISPVSLALPFCLDSAHPQHTKRTAAAIPDYNLYNKRELPSDFLQKQNEADSNLYFKSLFTPSSWPHGCLTRGNLSLSFLQPVWLCDHFLVNGNYVCGFSFNYLKGNCLLCTSSLSPF